MGEVVKSALSAHSVSGVALRGIGDIVTQWVIYRTTLADLGLSMVREIKQPQLRSIIKTYCIPFVLLVLFISCEKVIDIDPPEGGTGIVFEGSIESGSFPYVIISRSQGYFTPITTSATALAEFLVDSAQVFIEVDGVEYMLDRICLSNLPPEFQQEAQGILGISGLPDGFDICIYASLDPALTGVAGKSYAMRAIVDGEEYRSVTKIPEIVPLDSLWFGLDVNTASDTFGFVWATLNDPDTIGNSYYIWAKRLGRDNGYISVRGASFDDRLFNGERFDFNMARGRRFGTFDENEDEEFRFRRNDTVVIKFATIDTRVEKFWSTTRAATSAGFNPFSSPVTVMSNIDNNGRGVWGGYGVTYDTLVCIPAE